MSRLYHGTKKFTAASGETFHSAGEAERYGELLIMQKNGLISDLQRQVRYPLFGCHGPVLIRSPRYKNGRQVVYVADFVYRDAQNCPVVEDYKGYWTTEAKLKIAVFEAMEGTTVRLSGPQKTRKRRRAA